MDTTVSTTAKWSPQLNNFVTTYTVESLTAFPAIPAGAVNATKTFSDGVYRVTYDSVGDGSPGTPSTPSGSTYNYEIHTSTSTEPLKSFWKFATGQPWALSEADLKTIAECEAGTKKYADFINTGSDGLKAYSRLMVRGQESVYKPTITLSITADENSLPSMADIGKIASVSNAPTLPSGGNWLLTGMNATALQNGKWRVSREYRASGQGGWEPTVYGAGS